MTAPLLATPTHVAVINSSALPELDLALAVEALRAEAPKFCSSWSLPVPGIAVYPRGYVVGPSTGALYVIDTANDPTAFARHTALGSHPFGYVDLEVCRRGGEPWQRALSHELWEMLADPGLDRWIALPDGRSIAVEVSDGVNRTGYTVTAEFFGQKGEVPISNWCLPAFYAPGAAGPYDRLGIVKAPLTPIEGAHVQFARGGVIEVTGQCQASPGGRTSRRVAPG